MEASRPAAPGPVPAPPHPARRRGSRQQAAGPRLSSVQLSEDVQEDDRGCRPAPSTPRGRAGGPGSPAVTPRPLPACRDMFLLTTTTAYRSPTSVLLARVRSDVDRIADWQQAHPAGFDWSNLGSPKAVAQRWRAALGEIAADFVVDCDRYVVADSPLPLPDRRFALTVSGFLLFSYRELLDIHDLAMLELCRSNCAARIVPRWRAARCMCISFTTPVDALMLDFPSCKRSCGGGRAQRSSIHRVLFFAPAGQRPDARAGLERTRPHDPTSRQGGSELSGAGRRALRDRSVVDAVQLSSVGGSPATSSRWASRKRSTSPLITDAIEKS